MRTALLVSLVSFSACTVFPSEFPSAGQDAGVDAGNFAATDDCSNGSTLSDSSGEERTISLDGLSNAAANLGSCLATNIDGPEAFIQFRAVSAGERWRISAVPEDSTTDVVLHVSPSCDTSSCNAMQDRCGAGLEEATTYLTPNPGTFGVGIDTTEAGMGGNVRVLLQTAICGDGQKQAGEGCDDGNTIETDFCTSDCLQVIKTGGFSELEVEANDSFSDANIISLDDLSTEGTFEVAGTAFAQGRLGGLCDVDFFAVQVPAAHDLAVTMLATDDSPCDAATPAGLTMTLFNPTQLERGPPVVAAAGTCPALDPTMQTFAANLPAGTYFVSVSAPRGATGSPTPTVRYRLQVDVTPSI